MFTACRAHKRVHSGVRVRPAQYINTIDSIDTDLVSQYFTEITGIYNYMIVQ